jgi:3-hydroxymyristoyl/3-hydroxydecanoyl-(acyl carrier protein) dehydratase
VRWLLIDRVVDCAPGQRVTAVKTFPRSDLLFIDHFPGLPTVPGVLQIEMIAQAAGKCIRLARPSVLTMLGVVRSARFFRRIEPGEPCRITVEVDRMREGFAQVTGLIEVEGVRATRAELVIALVPSPTAPLDDPVIEDWRRRQAARHEQDSLEAGARPAAG